MEYQILQTVEQSLDQQMPSTVQEGTILRVEKLEVVTNCIFNRTIGQRKEIAFPVLTCTLKDEPYLTIQIPLSRILRGDWKRLAKYYSPSQSKREFFESLIGCDIKVVDFVTRGHDHDFNYAHSINFEFA